MLFSTEVFARQNWIKVLEDLKQRVSSKYASGIVDDSSVINCLKYRVKNAKVINLDAWANNYIRSGIAKLSADQITLPLISIATSQPKYDHPFYQAFQVLMTLITQTGQGFENFMIGYEGIHLYLVRGQDDKKEISWKEYFNDCNPVISNCDNFQAEYEDKKLIFPHFKGIKTVNCIPFFAKDDNIEEMSEPDGMVYVGGQCNYAVDYYSLYYRDRQIEGIVRQLKTEDSDNTVRPSDFTFGNKKK